MNLNLKLGIVIGLLSGIAVCGVPSPKPVLTSRIEPTGTQVPYKPTWIPLAPILTDSVAEPVVEVPLVTTVSESSNTADTPIVTDNSLDYIFAHESSNNPSAVNSIGCVGLGQSCGGGLETHCPNWNTDIECQIDYFTNYAIARYGSIAAATEYWKAARWW